MEIYRHNSYKKDFEKAIKQNIISDKEYIKIKCAIESLLNGASIPNHPLSGDYKGYFNHHIKGDLVLVYKISNDTLELVRIGRHADIFKGY